MASGAKPGFGVAGRVAVVEGSDLAAEGIAKDPADIGVESFIANICGRKGHAATDDRRESDANGYRVGSEQRPDKFCPGVDPGRLRGANAKALGGHLAGVEVDKSGFNGGAADVDPKREPGWLSRHGRTVPRVQASGCAGCVVTIAIGLGGAAIGGFVGSQLGWGSIARFDIRSIGLAFLGAVILLLILRALTDR